MGLYAFIALCLNTGTLRGLYVDSTVHGCETCGTLALRSTRNEFSFPVRIFDTPTMFSHEKKRHWESRAAKQYFFTCGIPLRYTSKKQSKRSSQSQPCLGKCNVAVPTQCQTLRPTGYWGSLNFYTVDIWMWQDYQPYAPTPSFTHFY